MKLLTKIPKTHLFLGIIIFLMVILSFFNLKNSNQVKDANSLSAARQQNTISQEKEEGNVDVKVEYLPQKSDKNKMVFQISLNTHSVNLDSFDFSKDILVIKEAKTDFPISTSISGGGHHRIGEVIFPIVSPPFTVKLKNLNAITRDFIFNF